MKLDTLLNELNENGVAAVDNWKKTGILQSEAEHTVGNGVIKLHSYRAQVDGEDSELRILFDEKKEAVLITGNKAASEAQYEKFEDLLWGGQVAYVGRNDADAGQIISDWLKDYAISDELYSHPDIEKIYRELDNKMSSETALKPAKPVVGEATARLNSSTRITQIGR